MTYRIEWTRQAQKDLDRLDATLRTRINAAVAELASEPRPPDARPVKSQPGDRDHGGHRDLVGAAAVPPSRDHAQLRDRRWLAPLARRGLGRARRLSRHHDEHSRADQDSRADDGRRASRPPLCDSVTDSGRSSNTVMPSVRFRCARRH